jgi:hypothetical protein
MDSQENRLSNIESRLSALESLLSVSRTNNEDKEKPAQAHSFKELQQKQTLEMQPWLTNNSFAQQTNDSAKWLGIVGGLCFVIAAIFIVKLSIDSGWFTPGRRLAISYLLGLGFIGLGFRLMKTDREYASLLPACGIVILYLSTLAAYFLYDLMSFYVGMMTVNIIAALSLYIYAQIRHEIYGIVATIGAYGLALTLNLSHTESFNIQFTLYYTLSLSVAFSLLAIWAQSRTLHVISAYFAITTTAILGLWAQQNEILALVLAGHFLIFSISTYYYAKINGDTLTESDAYSYFPILLVFYAAEYETISHIYPGLAPWFSLGFAGFLIALYLIAKKTLLVMEGSLSLIFGFTVIVAFHSIYLELLPPGLKPWCFVSIMIAMTCINRIKMNLSFFNQFVVMIPTALILGLEYFHMLSDMLRKNYPINPVVFFAILSLLTYVFFMNDKENKGIFKAVLASAHVLAITALYRLFEYEGSVIVSISWLGYALVIVAFGFFRKDALIANSAILVLIFASGKALLYDAAMTPTWVRIICLLLTGSVLYGCGYLFRQTQLWESKYKDSP